MRTFVGFYWTFPVRWINFLDLPEDAEDAARLSLTVAYQRELVLKYVAQEKGTLVHEVVTMEISPDRGTTAIKDYIARAGRACREAQATLLHVDFKLNGGWRSHPTLAEAVRELKRSGISSESLPADEIMLDGRSFDPANHFLKWRARDEEERERRRRLIPAALKVALAEVPAGRGRWTSAAKVLNEKGIPTLGGGKIWTADNVRKAAKSVQTEPV